MLILAKITLILRYLADIPIIMSIMNHILLEIHVPVVYTSLGPIRGYYKTSQKSRKYAAYEGIPYAEPPENDLRFRDPVPMKPWVGTLKATRKSSVCAQYVDVPPGKDGQPVLDGLIEGEDDCLYLNIYAPVLTDKHKKMPVILFIHGGSFQYASGNMFGDKFLADRDVIFVTFNYRLGILGFLSTEDAALPGNLGLKDQVLALQWTSKHIKHFGGDPTKITLAGFSAGSSSIQYHYLMPQSKGLFHGSVGMSGTAFNPWGFASNSLEKAKKLGAIFKCPTHDSHRMIECLRKVPVHKLVAATREFQAWQYNPEAPFAPVVDGVYVRKSPKDTFEARESNDVPAVYGMTSEEGCDPAAEYAPHDNLLRQLDEHWLHIAPHLLECNYTLPRNLHEVVANDSRREYFGDKPIDKDTVPQLISYLTDQRYFLGIEDGVRLQAKASRNPVYLYYYNFRGSQSYSDHLSRTTNNYGVCHTDDMNLVVENPDIDPTKTTKEWQMSNFLMDMWESVAYNGVPNIGLRWDPVDASDPELKFLHIYEPGHYNMSGSSNLGNKQFWKKYFFTV